MSSSDDQQRRSAKWDIHTGPRNYLMLVIMQAVSSVAALITAWLLTHLLGASGYGLISAIVAAAVFIGIAALNWSAMALARIGCEEFVETGYITRTFWARSAILALNCTLIAALAPWWLPRLTAWLQLTREAQVLLFVYLAATSFWGHIQSALQAAKLPSMRAMLLAVERLLIMGLVGSLLIIGHYSVTSVIWAFSLAAAGATLIGFWPLRHLIGWRPAVEMGQLRRVLLFSLPLIPQSLVSYFSTNYLDAWFILHYRSVAELGVYSIAFQSVGMIMQLPVLVGTLLIPLFTTLEVSREQEKVEAYTREMLPVLSWGWAFICTLLTPVIGWLIPLVLGEQFQLAAQLMWPLMAACVIAGPMSMGYVPLLNAKSATTALAVGAVLGAGTNVLLNFAFIPRWGLVGSGWATVIAYLVNLLVVAGLLRRWHRLSAGWALETVLPLIAGALVDSLTGNHSAALLLASSLLLALALFHYTALFNGARQLGKLWVRKYKLTLLSEP